MHTQRRIKFKREELINYRKREKITQKEFADMLNTKSNVVSYWETGRRTPLTHTVDQIVQLTGIPHEEFYEVNEESLGTKLTTLRLRKNISQKEMADRIGTNVESINRWEADKHTPSVYFMYHIAHVLDCSIISLITNEDGELLVHAPYYEGKS